MAAPQTKDNLTERIVKVEVRVKTTNPDHKKVQAVILRQVELAFGDAVSCGYVEVTPA